jgi:hypothetical protein
VKHREKTDAEHRSGEPCDRQVESEDGTERCERGERDETEHSNLGSHRDALGEGSVAAADGVREQQLETARLLLPGKQP